MDDKNNSDSSKPLKFFFQKLIGKITPLTLGVEIQNGQYYGIIKKNTKIPVCVRKTFTTISENQHSVEIHVLKGESGNINENISLGRFILSGIKSSSKGEIKIEIIFQIDAEGILHVQGKDKYSCIEHQIFIYNALNSKKNDIYKSNKLLVKKIEIITRKYKDKIENKFYNEIISILLKIKKKNGLKDLRYINQHKIQLETILNELNIIIDGQDW